MTNTHSPRTPDEIGRRGEELYERNLRDKLEAGEWGRFLALDVASGQYEIADDDLTATTRLLEALPKATVYTLRIGYPAAYRIGRSVVAEQR